MQFAQPFWIVVGIGCSLAVLLILHLLQERKRRILEKFAAAPILPRLMRNVSVRRQRTKHILLALGLLLICIALARPQYGFRWVEVKRKGIDILFALDCSNSMLTQDTKPNRLQRAKLGIFDFVNQLEGDRVGLIPFAGTAYLMCPLTLDYEAFNRSLKTVSTNLIPTGGTNLAAVIERAEQVLANDANHKILVLLTDGENLQGDVLGEAQRAKETGLIIHTVGIGSAQGELIPLPDNSSGGFIKDEQGRYVTSRLDEQTLTKIASITGGMYTPLGKSGEGLEKIYQQKLQLIPKQQLAEKRKKVPLERFTWPLLLGIALLFFEQCIPNGKVSTNRQQPNRREHLSAQSRKLVWLLLLLSPVFLARHSFAGEAETAYSQNEYLQAAQLYTTMLKSDPDNVVLHYNYGTTAYKNNLFEQAAASFGQALLSDDLLLQEKAYFNQGNALFKKGEESAQSSPQNTINEWEQAIEAYQGAMKLNPNNGHARDNHQYVKERLEQLKKQQQDQQQGSENQQDDQQEQQQDRNQQQSQQSENTGSQDEEKQDSSDNSGGQQSEEPQPEAEKKSENDIKQGNPPQEQPGIDSSQKIAPQTEAEKRRAQGKMTRQEALHLLNALKNEENELNFIEKGDQTEVGKDW